MVWTLTWTEHATEGGHQPGNYAIVARDGCGRDTRLERDIAVKGYRKRSRAIPSACSRAARIGIGWHRETGDYAATVAVLLNAEP